MNKTSPNLQETLNQNEILEVLVSQKVIQDIAPDLELNQKVEIQKSFWADSYCITRWEKPKNEALIWKKLSLEESLENLQIIGVFILDKRLWLKMYLEMITKLQDKIQNKLTKNLDLAILNGNLENFDNSFDNSNLQKTEKKTGERSKNKSENKVENKIKIAEKLQKMLEKLLNLEDFEQNLEKTLEETLIMEISNLQSGGSGKISENSEINLEENQSENAKIFAKLHELVLLEFWKSGDLNFWATNSGDFWEREIKNYLAQNNKKVGDYLWPLRTCLSGQKQSPSPFEILACLDYTETKRRIEICTNLV